MENIQFSEDRLYSGERLKVCSSMLGTSTGCSAWFCRHSFFTVGCTTVLSFPQYQPKTGSSAIFHLHILLVMQEIGLSVACELDSSEELIPNLICFPICAPSKSPPLCSNSQIVLSINFLSYIKCFPYVVTEHFCEMPSFKSHMLLLLTELLWNSV